MTIEGWKAISAELSQVWGVTVSVYSALRYARGAKLPVKRLCVPGSKRVRVIAHAPDVRQWAEQILSRTE